MAALQTVVYNPAGSEPVGLAVDAAGDLFIADYGLQRWWRFPPVAPAAAAGLRWAPDGSNRKP